MRIEIDNKHSFRILIEITNELNFNELEFEHLKDDLENIIEILAKRVIYIDKEIAR